MPHWIAINEQLTRFRNTRSYQKYNSCFSIIFCFYVGNDTITSIIIVTTKEEMQPVAASQDMSAHLKGRRSWNFCCWGAPLQLDAVFTRSRMFQFQLICQFKETLGFTTAHLSLTILFFLGDFVKTCSGVNDTLKQNKIMVLPSQQVLISLPWQHNYILQKHPLWPTV